ncbi:hypothetical protein AAMO2058_001347400 [Amorphochlora amoebiformis]
MTIRMHPLQSTSTAVRDLSSFGRFQKLKAGMLNGCRDVKELLILVHLQVCITIRDIIGRVMVENDWKPSDVAKIAETGRRCMNLVLAVFGKERVQPYVFAIFIELPVQLKLHLARDSLDVKDKTESRVFAVFLHEYITKTQALLLDLYTNSELKTFNTADNHISPLPMTVACVDALAKDAHTSICNHVWMADIETGRLSDELAAFLWSEEAQDTLSKSDLRQDIAPRPRESVHKVFTDTANELPIRRRELSEVAQSVESKVSGHKLTWRRNCIIELSESSRFLGNFFLEKFSVDYASQHVPSPTN